MEPRVAPFCCTGYWLAGGNVQGNVLLTVPSPGCNHRQMMRSIVLVIAIAFSSGCASRFLYDPDHKIYQTPQQEGLKFEDVNFTSSDGTALTGWFIPATKKAIGTVIHFHGRAGNMTADLPFVDWLPSEGFNVFTFDYRGYGRSAGTPQRRGVFNDSVAAIAYIQTRSDVDPNALLVFGQSLGGAIALAVLGESRYKRQFNGVKAVAIESTFYSYRSIVREKIGESPTRWLAKWSVPILVIDNRRSPAAVVKNISPTPLLLIHGTSDRVFPYYYAEDLFKKAREPKQLWTVKGGGHVEAFTVYGSLYRKRLVQFFTEALNNKM